MQGERLLRNVEVQALRTERMKAREKRTEITKSSKQWMSITWDESPGAPRLCRLSYCWHVTIR
ncbi:hypothetical protein KIG99_14520 [Quatrionicoccus australiensis]|nr:hypothetical protein [Quatrionicoccus australiensis]